MLDRSLTRQVLVASIFWIGAALLLTAALLIYFSWDHLERGYDSVVRMHLEEMADQSRLGTDGRLATVPHPTERRFDIRRSGWYWEVHHGGHVLARSQSLEGQSIGAGVPGLPGNGSVHQLKGPWDRRLRVQALDVAADPGAGVMRFVATAPVDDILAEVLDILEHTLLGFLLLAVLVLMAMVLQLRRALRPLRSVSEGVQRVRDGEAKTLEGRFPREVRPLVDQLNNLIEHSAIVAQRARNRLGDLAHAIKNPLTALNNEAYRMDEPRRKLVLEQTRSIEDSLKTHLARARVFGTEKVLGARTPVRAVVGDLVFLMQRVHAARGLDYDVSGLGDCCFRGDEQDLEEMLGNLLDNACKWAASRVLIHCRSSDRWLYVTIEDDGPGIPEACIERVLAGQRLDPGAEGHGRGLGIARDVVEMYGGQLALERSGMGGLRAELQLPGAWSTC